MKKISLVVFIIMALLCGCGEKYYNKWVQKNGKEYYYDEQGRVLKNCYSKIGGETYAFNKDGSLITNSIINLDGKVSYVDSGGRLKQYGWFSLEGHDYFVDQSKLSTGWKKHQNNWYYLDPKNYYMLKNQWVENKYYVDSSGKMLLNTTKEIGGKYYIFDSNGIAREKPEFELIVADYPNPIWAVDGLVRINKLNTIFKGFIGTYAFLEIEIDATPLILEYSSNILRFPYKIYDEEGYVVQNSWIDLDTHAQSFQSIKKRVSISIVTAKNKTYKMVISSD